MGVERREKREGRGSLSLAPVGNAECVVGEREEGREKDISTWWLASVSRLKNEKKNKINISRLYVGCFFLGVGGMV